MPSCRPVLAELAPLPRNTVTPRLEGRDPCEMVTRPPLHVQARARRSGSLERLMRPHFLGQPAAVRVNAARRQEPGQEEQPFHGGVQESPGSVRRWSVVRKGLRVPGRKTAPIRKRCSWPCPPSLARCQGSGSFAARVEAAAPSRAGGHDADSRGRSLSRRCGFLGLMRSAQDGRPVG